MLALAAVAFSILVIEVSISDGFAGATISISFLILLPMALGTLAAFLSNPAGDGRSSGAAAAAGLVLVVLLLGALIFREGVICMVIVAPIWFVSAWIGSSWLLYAQRRYDRRGTTECSVLIALPVVAILVESQIGHPTQHITVERSVEIDAPAEDVWPFLLELRDLSPDEGRYNFAQDVLGIPRPSGAIVEGSGVGAVRYASWGEGITFQEHITRWQEGVALEWAFVFPNDSLQHRTDRHIAPDGYHLTIESGGYSLEPLADNKSLLHLHTTYRLTTAVNPYAALWGEVFLGGIQKNILGLIEDRAEQASPSSERAG